jgi:hypothetical protein
MPDPGSMTCREFVELVTEYQDGVLSDASRVRFERHASDCPHCAVYLDQMRVVVHALGQVTLASSSAAIEAELCMLFRNWEKGSRPRKLYALDRADHRVPAGSHIAKYYTSDEDRDRFARQYLAAGLAAGESCVILGDPVFVASAADLLGGLTPPGGWSGRLFSAPWSREPSESAVRDFVDLHIGLTKQGPVGFLPEVPLTYADWAGPGTRFRGLGNFRHWSTTEFGSHCLLQICASVQVAYQDAAGIIACMYELPGRPAELRWGGLAVHSHLVNGTCIAQPCEILERFAQSDVEDADRLMRSLQGVLARGDAVEISRAVEQTRSSIVKMRPLLSSLHVGAPAMDQTEDR